MQRRDLKIGFLLIVACCSAAFAGGNDQTVTSDWLALGEDLQGSTAEGAAGKTQAPCPPAKEWTKPIPLSFGIEYALASDYVFRGINYSEYSGEGREKPNHQMSIWAEIDSGNFGVFGAAFWFEWFAGQEHLTPGSDGHLQEVDYTAYWRYNVKPIDTTVELGWSAYTYPQLTGDASWTNEVYAKLTYDDSKLFGAAKPVLNPFVAYYQDVDDVKAGWMDVGVKHDFAMSDFAAVKDVPIAKDFTLSPSVVLGVDHRYLPKALGEGQPSTRLGNITYGLDVCYDLGGALKIPAKYGSLKVGGFLKYSQAFEDIIHDEFWGGTKVSYSW